jgi:hypothetical protein
MSPRASWLSLLERATPTLAPSIDGTAMQAAVYMSALPAKKKPLAATVDAQLRDVMEVDAAATCE